MGDKKDILVIGDAHSKPGVSNDRFTWLAKYALEKRPHIIIDMGDWADMPSLSSYDKGRLSFEGRTYQQDIASAKDARRRFDLVLAAYQKENRARGRKVRYLPEKIALGGNHEEGRIRRVIEDNRELSGTIKVEDFCHAEYGWKYYPFLTSVEVQGFTFCHYFSSGVMGRPIGGEMPAYNLLRKQFKSCVSGHNHLWDIAHRTRADGKRIWGLFSGCYLAADQWEDYAAQANKLWWRGLTILKGCYDGDLDSFETISIGELEAKYG